MCLLGHIATKCRATNKLSYAPKLIEKLENKLMHMDSLQKTRNKFVETMKKKELAEEKKFSIEQKVTTHVVNAPKGP